jgi:riboflavin synthase
MLAELILSIWWVISDDYSAVSVSAGVFVLIVWLSTFVLQVPIHNRLKAGKEDREIRHLVATNWIRTAAWSLKAVVVSIDRLSSIY